MSLSVYSSLLCILSCSCSFSSKQWHFFITKKSYSNIKNCVENNTTNTFTSCPVSVNRILQTEFLSLPLLEHFLHPFIWISISFYLWIFDYKCTSTSYMRVHIVFTCKTLHMKGTFRQGCWDDEVTLFWGIGLGLRLHWPSVITGALGGGDKKIKVRNWKLQWS